LYTTDIAANGDGIRGRFVEQMMAAQAEARNRFAVRE